jgi:hypothetical protein
MMSIKNIIVILIAGFVIACTSGNKEFHVANYGAVGDGITDDGAAVRKAVEAAVRAGKGSKVVFDNKTYRLDKYDGNYYHINLEDVSEITIEGNGAEIINNPYNSILNVENCENITFRGFKFDCFPLPFTQGTITKVDKENGKFYIQIHKGYDNPVEVYRKINKKPQWGWGVCIDPLERKRKPEAIMHLFIKDVTAADAGIVCVELRDDYKSHISELSVNDRFVITLKYSGSGSNIWVHHSKDIHLEDYTFYTAKYGMTHAFTQNRGRIYANGVNITFKPGTDRLITTPKDGFHCKHNAVGPVIENGLYEGMLDDAINISVCPYWIKKELGDNKYLIAEKDLSSAPKQGDTLMAYTPNTGSVVQDIVVLKIEKQTSPKDKREAWNIITLNKSIPNVGLHQGDNLFPGGKEKLIFTGLYNVSASGKDYIIRNNIFREQRRYGVLARASGGLIEGNSFIGVGGCGIYLGNEIGSFYEGPFPANTTIRNNTFINTAWNSVRVTTKGENVYAKNINIIDNFFSGWRTSPLVKGKAAAIDLKNIDGGKVTGNIMEQRKASGYPPIINTNCKKLIISNNNFKSKR